MILEQKTLSIHTDRVFGTLNEFFNFHRVPPPLDPDFDIREADLEFQVRFRKKGFPLHHQLYCLSLVQERDSITRLALHSTAFEKPTISFFAPDYNMDHVAVDDTRKIYYIIFTENFLNRNRHLAAPVADLPFFLNKAPLSYPIDPGDSVLLANISNILFDEYKSRYSHRLDLLASYVHILLTHTRRLYERVAQTKSVFASGLEPQQPALIDRFRSHVKRHVGSREMAEEARFVNFYAEQLFVHPNHLNAIVKKTTGRPALTFIHKQIIGEAISLLNETEMSVKEIAYRLAFKEPSHFISFFRKNTSITPAAYRVSVCA
ncbi:helix-turn-helix domain-containing protein [Mucilaginibacter sp. cycad4]|uniref:AraC family transcriptional regulator n=1 Tax=Mucilaginibacter sp. cycad4 TaxID=3342096 RepID=UPI002AAB9FC2|nr:helix-turn-helix domain-containing protein [Mucilaginibacter gossypii]WPU99127.1 helix-turn-helix domain-containing protein [Mucilaginibacter gossypii]